MPKNANPALDYIRALYAPQDALLAAIDAKLHEIGMPIHIGAEEGKLLQMLIGLHGAKNIVEIGTLAGYSTIWMARALPENGHIYTIDKDRKHAALAREFFAQSEVKDRITSLEGDAHKILQTLTIPPPLGGRLGGGHNLAPSKQVSPHPGPPPDGEGEKFDMLFIDADKISYPDYLDWAENNIRAGGLIAADNTLLFGAVYENSPPEGTAPTTWKAMRNFNERLADTTKYFTTMIPTEQGLSVAVKLF